MKNLLIKIRDELAKESPDLSYCRGILEVLIEEKEETKVNYLPIFPETKVSTMPPFLPPTIAGAKRLPEDNSNEVA